MSTSVENTLKLALEALEWATSCMSFEDFDAMPEALEELNKAHPPTPWTVKKIKEYAQQQRAQTEDALL